MITEHDILAQFPRAGFERFALSAIRVALRSTTSELLFEYTRRFAQSWRGVADMSACPNALECYQKRIYLDESLWGPRRGYLQPDKPVYEQIDRARNNHAPDVKLEAEVMRKI